MRFGGRNVALAWLAGAVVTLGGCGLIAPEAGDESPSASAETLGTVVTSPDGTITVTLPPGWYDNSTDYFAYQADSTFSATWSTDPVFSTDPDVFATISTTPIGGVTVSLAERHRVFLEDWIDDFDEPEITNGDFVTDDGAEAMWSTLVGTAHGEDISLTAVVIADGERAAKIAIQTPADDPAMGELLLKALHTVTLADVDEDVEAAGTIVDGAYTDGNVTVTIPAYWETMLSDDEARDGALGTEASYFGGWITSLDTLDTASSALITISKRSVGSPTPEDFAADLGPVGSIQEDAKGTVEVVSVADFQPTPDIGGKRICTRATRSDTGQSGDVCMYELVIGEFRVFGSLQARTLEPTAMTDFESVLATVAIADAAA